MSTVVYAGTEPAAIPAIDVTDYQGAVGVQLAVPGHLDPLDGETTHPSVVYIPEGFNGYTYWMAHTPYPGSNNDHEDPNIVASNDGTTWVVPAGLTNPIDDATGQPSYNSDPHLRFVDNQFFLIWRFVDGGTETLYFSSSADGITWAAKQVALVSDRAVSSVLSPSIMFEDGQWIMWGVNTVPAVNEVVRMTGTNLLSGPWSAAQVCPVAPMPAGMESWHLSIHKTGAQYVGLLNTTTSGQTGHDGGLLLMTSDDGLNWETSGQTVIPKAATAHDDLYRASLVPVIMDGWTKFDVWYSARLDTSPEVWHVFRTSLNPSAYAAGLSLETFMDYPCPRVGVTITGLEVTGQPVSLWRTADGRRMPVRMARDITVNEGAYIIDYEAPLGRPVRYDLEVLEGPEPPKLAGTAFLDSATGFIQDALVPSTAVAVAGRGKGDTALANGALATFTKESAHTTMPIQGSDTPISLGGQRQKATGLVLSLVTLTVEDTDRLRTLLDNTHLAYIRPLPAWGNALDPALTLAVPTVEEQPAGAPYGEAVTLWTLTGDVVRAPAGNVVIPIVSWEYVASLYSTWEQFELTKQGQTWLDVVKNPEVS